jgi:hypothetical protein
MNNAPRLRALSIPMWSKLSLTEYLQQMTWAMSTVNLFYNSPSRNVNGLCTDSIWEIRFLWWCVFRLWISGLVHCVVSSVAPRIWWKVKAACTSETFISKDKISVTTKIYNNQQPTLHLTLDKSLKMCFVRATIKSVFNWWSYSKSLQLWCEWFIHMLLWDTATALKCDSREHFPTNTKTSPAASHILSYFFGL